MSALTEKLIDGINSVSSDLVSLSGSLRHPVENALLYLEGLKLELGAGITDYKMLIDQCEYHQHELNRHLDDYLGSRSSLVEDETEEELATTELVMSLTEVLFPLTQFMVGLESLLDATRIKALVDNCMTLLMVAKHGVMAFSSELESKREVLVSDLLSNRESPTTDVSLAI